MTRREHLSVHGSSNNTAVYRNICSLKGSTIWNEEGKVEEARLHRMLVKDLAALLIVHRARSSWSG